MCNNCNNSWITNNKLINNFTLVIADYESICSSYFKYMQFLFKCYKSPEFFKLISISIFPLLKNVAHVKSHVKQIQVTNNFNSSCKFFLFLLNNKFNSLSYRLCSNNILKYANYNVTQYAKDVIFKRKYLILNQFKEKKNNDILQEFFFFFNDADLVIQ